MAMLVLNGKFETETGRIAGFPIVRDLWGYEHLSRRALSAQL
jgi:hypothetical protein